MWSACLRVATLKVHQEFHELHMRVLVFQFQLVTSEDFNPLAVNINYNKNIDLIKALHNVINTCHKSTAKIQNGGDKKYTM